MCSSHLAFGILHAGSNLASPLVLLCSVPCSTVITCSPTIDGDPFPKHRLWIGALRHGTGGDWAAANAFREIDFYPLDAQLFYAVMATAGEAHCREVTSCEVRAGRPGRGHGCSRACRPQRSPALVLSCLDTAFCTCCLCRVSHVQCMGLWSRFCGHRHSFNNVLLSYISTTITLFHTLRSLTLARVRA